MKDYPVETSEADEQLTNAAASATGTASPRLTRRHLLISAGAAVGSFVVLRVVDVRKVSSAPGEITLIGVVERVDSPRALNVRTTAGPGVIRFSDDAIFWRGRSGRVTGLAAFVTGDEVVAEGQWATNVFTAATLMSLYRFIEGRITQRQGDRLQTTGGAVQLMPDTVLLGGHGFMGKPLAQLAAGDDIVADAWRDPTTGNLVALRMGVRMAGP